MTYEIVIREEIMPKSSKDQMSIDEKKVLSELTRNANKNIEFIAKACHFSKQKTWRIINRLQTNDLIWGYTVVFNEEKIGLKHFMVMVKRTMKQLDQKTVDKIVSRKFEDIVKDLGITIESSCYVHGDYDWVLTFTAPDIIQAKKFADSLVSFHPGVIEKVTIIETLMFIRRHYILNPEKNRLREFL
jgi:DNA-binding Lrp family transcriptional regulator